MWDNTIVCVCALLDMVAADLYIISGGSGGEMADSRLVPPQPFDFRKPDEWPRWLRRFEQYRVASGLSTEDEEKQVNTLLYCLGEEAGDKF